MTANYDDIDPRRRAEWRQQFQDEASGIAAQQQIMQDGTNPAAARRAGQLLAAIRSENFMHDSLPPSPSPEN